MWQCSTATHCFGFDFEKMRSRVNFWRCWFQVIVRPWLGSRLTRSYSLVGIAPPVSCLIAPATSYAWPVPDPGIGCYANDRPSGGRGVFPVATYVGGVGRSRPTENISRYLFSGILDAFIRRNSGSRVVDSIAFDEWVLIH